MSEKSIKTKSNRGGARAGAGRPAGSKNKISTATTETVLDLLYDKTGRVYEDLLLEDFLRARSTNDSLAHKYHSLLANKLMPDLNRIELTQDEDQLIAKQQAFAAALAAIAGKDTGNK